VIDELAAVKARVAGLRSTGAYAVHVAYADPKAQTLPYFVLGAPGWDSPDDVPLCGVDDDLDAEIRVKAVERSGGAVLVLLKKVRDNLSPGKQSSVLVVEGRAARIKFVRSEFVAADTSVTLTDGTHPTQGVDTYRITSQPTG
jgi:hypothetical protein